MDNMESYMLLHLVSTFFSNINNDVTDGRVAVVSGQRFFVLSDLFCIFSAFNVGAPRGVNCFIKNSRHQNSGYDLHWRSQS